MTTLLILRTQSSASALEASERHWRDMFENSPTMYFMVDASGAVLAVNSIGAEHLGYTVTELVGRPVTDVFLESDRRAAQRELATCLGELGRSFV